MFLPLDLTAARLRFAARRAT